MAYDRLDELQILCGSLADLSEEMEVDLGHLPFELVGKYIQGTRGLADDITREIYELRSELAEAAVALEPPAEAAPEPQEIETSSQSEPFVSWPAETELQPLPGGAEESRDYSDDASEFFEEGYAPVIDPEPSPLIDAQTCEPINPHPEPETLADPLWNEPEPTKPEADSIAKALDYYDPKAVAERERRNPFNIFKREDA